jgi:ornithine cyclodeaminase/alanine dehydrogenase-like protein (mu-crystallin family)
MAMAVVMNDEDIRIRLNGADAVRWMGEAIDAQHRCELVAPPRLHVDLDQGRLVFTTGQLRGAWFGYRSYDSLPSNPCSQLVVVHDEATGEVRGIAVGNELGPRRVGAVGAVAADALASSSASVVAVIGSGTQAWYQLWALAAVRELREIRVYSRSGSRRATFVEQLRSVTNATCRASADAKSAVEGAEIVILATDSPTPVIESG